jgi:Ras-related C3 botulinum toxin substrate 1
MLWLDISEVSVHRLLSHNTHQNPSITTIFIYFQWYPEVSQHSPNAPIFLVGTKLDLRNDEKVLELLKSRDLSPVTTAQALETKDAIGACRYIECSSLTRENLQNLFDEVLRVVLVASKRKNKKCLIM